MGCVRQALASIRQLPGIYETSGDLESVTVVYDPEQVTVEEISQAIERVGYRVEGIFSNR